MGRRNGTTYESEWRNLLRENEHVAVLGSIIDVDVVDVCCKIVYEVKSAMSKLERNSYFKLDNDRLKEQFVKMREYSKKVPARYVIRYPQKKWYYRDIHPTDPLPTSMDYIEDFNWESDPAGIISKGRTIMFMLKPVEDMKYLCPES